MSSEDAGLLELLKATLKSRGPDALGGCDIASHDLHLVASVLHLRGTSIMYVHTKLHEVSFSFSFPSVFHPFHYELVYIDFRPLLSFLPDQ